MMIKSAATLSLLMLSGTALAKVETTTIIPVTCDNLASTFRSAPSGAMLQLSGNCNRIVLRDRDLPIRVTAGVRGDPRAEPRATIRGLEINNVKNLTWIGGHIQAPLGKAGIGKNGYGVNIVFSENVTLSSVHISNAVKGFLVGSSKDIGLFNSYLEDLRADGVNFTDSDGFRMVGNTFRNFSPIPTSCTFSNGSVQSGLSRAACDGQGGVWRDGDHPDVFQTWHKAKDRVSNILLQRNDIFLPRPNWSMGLTTHGAKRVENMQVLDNRVLVDSGTAIRIDPCFGNCLIRGNIVGPASDPSINTRIIKADDDTFACGNAVLSRNTYGTEPCP